MNEIITAITILLIMISSVCIYRLGLKDGRDQAQGREIKSLNPVPKVVKAVKKLKKTPEDKEQEKLQALIHNISVYDGSRKGQIDVR